MSHYYTIVIGKSSIELPSVTTQIMELNKKGLFGDPLILKNRDESMSLGNQAHAIIDRINKKENITTDEWLALDERVRQAVRGFLRFREAIKFRVRQSEYTVYSLKHGYAGTIDAIGTSGHKIGIVDFKTGDMPGWYVELQLSLYYSAYKEMYPRRKVYYLWWVNINKFNGSYLVHSLSIQKAKELFDLYLEIKKEAGLI